MYVYYLHFYFYLIPTLSQGITRPQNSYPLSLHPLYDPGKQCVTELAITSWVPGILDVPPYRIQPLTLKDTQLTRGWTAQRTPVSRQLPCCYCYCVCFLGITDGKKKHHILQVVWPFSTTLFARFDIFSKVLVFIIFCPGLTSGSCAKNWTSGNPVKIPELKVINVSDDERCENLWSQMTNTYNRGRRSGYFLLWVKTLRPK